MLSHQLSIPPPNSEEQQQEIDRWSPAALLPTRAFYKKAAARPSKRQGLYTIEEGPGLTLQGDVLHLDRDCDKAFEIKFAPHIYHILDSMA